MTLQDKLAAVQAEIDNAKSMMEKRLSEAVKDFEHDTGLQVATMTVGGQGKVTATTFADKPTVNGKPRPRGLLSDVLDDKDAVTLRTSAVQRSESGLL